MARASSRASEFHTVDSGTVEIRRDGAISTLFLNGIESSAINTVDPSALEFEYMQHASCALDTAFPSGEPVRAIHLGAAGCALPLAWSLQHPGSKQTAVEVDAALARGVRHWFDLPPSPALAIRVGDGRAILEQIRPRTADVIVRDAFANGHVPSHMATRQFIELARSRLKPTGLLILNCAHGAGEDARNEIATTRTVFPEVLSIQDPKVGRSGRRGNVLVIAYEHTLGSYSADDLDRRLRRLPLPARVKRPAELKKWAQGARILTDEDGPPLRP